MESLVVRSPEKFREKYCIDVRTLHEVVEIDSASRRVKGSGRLLGGQIVGSDGSAKRIDVIAAALHAGLTAEEMINIDLGYAPPYSPVWDPLLIAAREVAKLV